MEDRGSTHVLEAVILALVLLAAAWSVTTLRTPSLETDRPRANLERLSHDSLVVLAGLEENGQRVLEQYMTEAYHCAKDAVPSTISCHGPRGANLSLRLEYYLPAGAGYAVAMDNGVAVRDIYRSVLPAGETASSSFSFAPVWNMSFVLPELSCYEAGMDVNASIVPLRNGAPAIVNASSMEWSGGNASLTRAHAPGLYNATAPALTRPAEGTLFTNISSRGGLTHPGAANYSSCGLGGLGPTIVASLRDVPFRVGPPTPLARDLSLQAELSGILGLSGVVVREAKFVIYEPVPGRGWEPDTYVAAARIPLPVSSSVAANWTVPENAFYGTHPTVLELTLDVAGVEVQARRVELAHVALPSGHVPIDPPYRAVLQVWFPDWS